MPATVHLKTFNSFISCFLPLSSQTIEKRTHLGGNHGWGTRVCQTEEGTDDNLAAIVYATTVEKPSPHQYAREV